MDGAALPIVFSAVRAVAIDLDGVVYEGSHLLPGADRAVRELRDAGLRVFFATNNSTRARRQIADKLNRMGIAAAEAEVFNSAHATAVLLARLNTGRESRILVIGSEGLREELLRMGLSLVAEGPCEFLVVGLDVAFDYGKLAAALAALEEQATFVVCNRDTRYPVEGGRLLPGCGALVAAIEAAAGRSPDYCAGKPNPLMLKLLAEENDLRPEEILMVGDGLESDIAMANRFGSPAVYIRADHQSLGLHPQEIATAKPTFMVASLASIPSLFRRVERSGRPFFASL